MLGLASKIKATYPPRVRFGRGGCLTLSHLSAAGGTAKVHADWAFVSGVSPVSPNLKLIDRIQSGKGTGGISCRQALCAETGGTGGTGGTGTKVTRFSGETTGLRHTWDRWDTPKPGQGGRSANVKPCDQFVMREVRREQDLATWAAAMGAIVHTLNTTRALFCAVFPPVQAHSVHQHKLTHSITRVQPHTMT
jgi:hypothetical protein